MKKIVPFVIIFILCFFASRSLFVPGFFTIHDDEQIARLYDLNTSVLAGQIPPRWVSHLGFGYGYPLFNFYPPLVYYVGEIFYLVGFSLITSTKIVIGLGYVLSALFMYLWVKKRYGVLAGIVSVVLYTYAPYHSVEIYVRGDLAEFFSFVWIPAVFWSLDRVFCKKNIQSAMIAGIFLSLVVLTHSLTALAFLPFLFIYSGYLLYTYRKEIKKVFSLVFLSGLLGIGLSAYFWLPSLIEKKYTLVDAILTGELADYTLHFVAFRQFWNSPWGYGASVLGPWDGLSFQIGKVHLIVSAISLVGILLVFFVKKIKISFLLPFVIFVMFVLSVGMATKYSLPIWQRIQPLSYLQFPWRFLLFTAVFTSFLGGFCIKILQIYCNRIVVALLSVGIIVGTLFLMINNMHPQTYLPVTDAFYTTHNDIEWRVSSLSYEYVPKGVATILSKQKTTKLAITKKDIPQKPYVALSKNMHVSVVENKPQIKRFVVTASGQGLLQVNTFSFPGWQVWMDGKQVQFSDKNRLHLITVSVPKGKHKITVMLVNTVSRTFANAITMMTVCMIIGYYLWMVKVRANK